ncbi:ROK family protein [Yeguia hominis]|uniref:ROK family protein n=1 Tax=Yeguia hominis TaxID=2763662 RepID=A0A926HRC1_9FIRM|nr:ROK family protein [Yeguia hominis]MBC8533629.1 ROK family protein [Yeguia hominis]
MKKKAIQASQGNRAKVVSCFTNRRPLTQEDVIWTTKLSRPTVVEIIKGLIADGVIHKIGTRSSTGGRSPYLYGLTDDLYYSIGIDFDYPRLTVGILNLSCEVLLENTVFLASNLLPADILQCMFEKIDSLIARFDCNKDQYIGICISIPGLINETSGVSIQLERISGWENINLKEFFEQHFGIATYVKNDINMVAQLIYETKQNLPEDFLFIGNRTGIGMAIMQKGEPYLGIKGNAGFLGHVTINMDGDLCNCGKRGCLESIAGENAILLQYKKLTGNHIQTENAYSTLTQLSDMGDQNAQIVLTRASRALAISVANMVKIFEIPTVILDGWKLAVIEPYRQIFETTLRENLFENISYDLNLIYSRSNPTDVIHACGSSVVKHYIQKRYEIL